MSWYNVISCNSSYYPKMLYVEETYKFLANYISHAILSSVLYKQS